MAATALAQANGAERMMVICGSRHVDSLAQRFQAAGHTVKTVYLQDVSWNIEDWATHMMINL